MNTPTQNQFGAYQSMYDYFNGKLFNGKLAQVLLNFSRKSKAYGFFAPKRWDQGENIVHEISLNPSLLKRPIDEVCSTLVHEMCHLEVQDDGKASRNGYHSKYWANKMEEVGLMASTTGAIGGKKTGQHVSHYIIPGGKFDVAFKEIPQEYLLPWSCSDLELVKKQVQKRSKYVCETDNVKVYGKQELFVRCGLCNGMMHEFQSK
jgi:predicted SprT family Zn-dependent metalloprotease